MQQRYRNRAMNVVVMYRLLLFLSVLNKEIRIEQHRYKET